MPRAASLKIPSPLPASTTLTPWYSIMRMNNEAEEIKPGTLYGVSQVAALVGCTRGNIHAKIKAGTIRVQRIGTDWFAKGSEVKRLIAEKALKSAPGGNS